MSKPLVLFSAVIVLVVLGLLFYLGRSELEKQPLELFDSNQKEKTASGKLKRNQH